ncbi:MAG: DinB family protein [Desulfobacterales bacterium]|nr:MAG: DinB family protein [Desulfobacterales bacterium]
MKDIPDLLNGLERTLRILSEFVQSIPAEKMNLRRGDGFWTIAEHVSHLAQVQPMLLERLQRFMAEDRPEFVPYIPGDAEAEARPPQMEIDAALESFAHHRKQQLTLLDKADEAVWRKTAGHPEYELYSMHILVRHILMHDYWHMYRMEELWLTRDAYLTRLD